MLEKKLSSHFEPKLKIKEAIQYLEPDFEIVTKEGAIILVNKLLLSLSSPLLKNLLTGHMSSPDRIHLPDVSAAGLIHLMNVVKNGFTTGIGPGYSVLKEIRDVAEVLGFQDPPVTAVLTFEIQRNNQEVVQDFLQNDPVESHEDVSVDGKMDYVDKSIEPGDTMAENQHKVVDGNTDTMDALVEPEDGEINVKMEIDEDNDKSQKIVRRSSCLKMGHYSRKGSQPPKSQECELTEERINRSQEVTEVHAKVLKVEVVLEDGDQNHSMDDIPMFPCGECSKRFSNAGSLLVHSEQHEEKTGKKNCPLCHLSGTRTSLLSHVRAKHTKEKLFSCAFCQQLFTTCTSKKKHEKKHRHS